MDTVQTDIMLVYGERCQQYSMRKELKKLEAEVVRATQNQERPSDYPPLASYDESIYGDIRESRGRLDEVTAIYRDLEARYIRQSKYVKFLIHRLRDKHGDEVVSKYREMVEHLVDVKREYERVRDHLMMKKMRYGVAIVQQCISAYKKTPDLLDAEDSQFLRNLDREIVGQVATGKYRSDIKVIRSMIMDGSLKDDCVIEIGSRIGGSYESDDKLETKADALKKDVGLFVDVAIRIREHTLLGDE